MSVNPWAILAELEAKQDKTAVVLPMLDWPPPGTGLSPLHKAVEEKRKSKYPIPIDLITGELFRRGAIKKGYLPEPIIPKIKQLSPWDLIELELKLQNQGNYKLNPSKEDLET